MGKPRRFGDLEVGFDPVHEEREWIVQRAAWALMGFLVMAALLGALGPGPLSRAREGKAGAPLRVEYHRFARHQAPEEVRVYCRPRGSEEFRLSFDRGFIEGTEIEEISPEPREAITAGDRYVFVFKREGGEEHLVTFRFQSEQFGRAATQVTLDGGESVEVRQFYWP